MKLKNRFTGILLPVKSQKIYKYIFIIIYLCTKTITATGQNAASSLTITGKVIDEAGQSIPVANIHLEHSKTTVTADQNGIFRIPAASVKAVLTVSFIGFQTAHITVNYPFPGLLTITLKQGNMMKEVSISTGYQQIPKERVTGSFAQVDNELFNRRTGTDVISRLEGVVPGLLFNRNTATSSRGNNDLSIRGTSTLFGQTQPLIIVDGFPYEGDFNSINPNTVESISVLKDAAAASIWGVKSGNGVIVITTKHGSKKQKTAIEINSNVTIGQKPDLYYNPNFTNSNDFINEEQALFSKGAYDNDLKNAYTTVSPVIAILAKQRAGQITQADATSQINALRNNDIRDDLSKYLYQRSVSQQYALNLKGGGEYSDYFLSGGYDNNLSNQAGNQNQRVTLNANYNFYPVKNLVLSAVINYIQNNYTSNSPLANITGGGTKAGIYPYAQLADINGNSLAIVKDYASAYTDTAGRGRFYDWKYRPIDELHNADNTSKLVDNRINIGVKYTFPSGISADLKYQYEQQNLNSNNYFSNQTYYTRNLINQFTQGYPGTTLSYPIPQNGILQQSVNEVLAHKGRFQLNYSRVFLSKHEINAIAGSEINQAITQGSAGTVYGYNKDNNTTQSVNLATQYTTLPTKSSALLPNTLGYSTFTDRYISYYGNGAYTYDRRYTLSLSGRIDKSNLFGVNTNQKSVPLYSAGIAWNISKEPFYHLDLFNSVKLRATYGYNGNIDKNVTAVTTIRQLTGNPYSGTPYAQIANPGNPELRWEKSRIINFGVDLSLKNGILSGSFDYYLKKGIDLFGDAPLAPSTGLTTFRGNDADISGNGFELVLNSRNIRLKDFEWSSGLLLSHAVDIVSRYAVNTTISNYLGSGSGSGGAIYPLEGRPLYAIYSYPWAGLSPVNGDPQGYLNGKVSTDYNAIIAAATPDNLQLNGSARPTTYGSIINTFNYKSFSVSANLIFKLNYFFRRSSISSTGPIQSWLGNNDYAQRWQKPGDESITNVPSIQYPPISTNRESFYQFADVLVEKGDHIRLQDINLSYRFSSASAGRIGIRSIQVYSYINNIGLIWTANKRGLDPDIYAQGYGNAIPAPRTIAFGIKLTL